MNNIYHGIFGYCDDNWVLSPTLSGLQEMMTTIETYCYEHMLKFSTDPKPEKCKTKCIAFLLKKRCLPDIVLCGNKLPWVSEGVHLGNQFSSCYDGFLRDISNKRALFIQKNCELLQEFSFAHPTTKFKTILIYNSHFTGSPLWDLFSQEAVRLENAWNIAVRKCFDLPYTAHRYLIEPISGTCHLKKILIKRFLSFIRQIENSPKNVPKMLLNVVKNDTRSITGKNVRMVKLLTDIADIDAVKRSDVEKIEYAACKKDDLWRIKIINEIVEARYGQMEIHDFKVEDLDNIMEYVCTS